MPPPTIIGGKHRVFGSSCRPSGCPCVFRPYVNTSAWRDFFSRTVEGFQWYISHIIMMWMDIVQTAYKVIQGQPWKAYQLNSSSTAKWIWIRAYRNTLEMTWWRFQCNGFKGHGHGNVRGQRHTDRRLAVEDHLVLFWSKHIIVMLLALHF